MRAIIIIIVTGLVVSGGALAQSAKDDTTGSAYAKLMLEKVWEGSRQYYQDRGSYPTTVEQLIESRYLEADSVFLAEWRFRFQFDAPHFIRAIRNEPIPYGLDNYPTVTYDVTQDRFSGYGIPRYGSVDLNAQQQSDLVKGVKRVMQEIVFMSDIFYNDRGVWPMSVEELYRSRYVRIEQGIYVSWEFTLIGAPPEAVRAVSTHVMPDGKGKELTYDIATKKFSGYGVDE